MRKVPVNIKKLKANAALPVYSSAAAAGAELRACLEEDVIIRPGKTEMISTGLAMEVPEGYAGLIYARSGLASKRGLAPANKVGVIDSDYRGEIMGAAQPLGRSRCHISWRTDRAIDHHAVFDRGIHGKRSAGRN